MKKLLSILLVWVLLLSALPVRASVWDDLEMVQTGTCGDNLTWYLEPNGKLHITGTGAMYNYTEDSPAPWCMGYVEAVYIDKGVTSIGDYAFARNPEVCGVDATSKSKMERIGSHAFAGSHLIDITLSDAVKTIGDFAFGDCLYLTRVYFYGNAPELEVDPETGVQRVFKTLDAETGEYINIPDLWLEYQVYSGGWTQPTWNGYPSWCLDGDYYTDVSNDDYFFKPIVWLERQNPSIIGGVGDGMFAPNSGCTRGQAVSILYRLANCQEPGKDDAGGSGEKDPDMTLAGENPFTDVSESAYYYGPVLWAAKNGIASGVDASHFAPKAACTRAQVVMMLWSKAGRPKAEKQECPFTDVAGDKYYYEAVLWAVENGVAGGTTETTFSPNAECTRGQFVTFLYHYLNRK